MIFTSFYAHPDIKGRDNVYGISASVPDFYTGNRIQELAPTWDLLNAYHREEIDEDEYSDQYLMLLLNRGLDPNTMFDNLPSGSILLCYERMGEFCHRRVLADWVSSHTGMTIPEWVSEQTLRQLELVADIVEF